MKAQLLSQIFFICSKALLTNCSTKISITNQSANVCITLEFLFIFYASMHMTDKTFSRMSKAHNQHAAMSQNWALANPLHTVSDLKKNCILNFFSSLFTL